MSELRPCDHDSRVLTTGDVLQASNIVVKSYMFPCRIVIRDISRAHRPEFVVHTELLETTAPGSRDVSCGFRHYAFDQGDYTDTLEKAQARFHERAGRL